MPIQITARRDGFRRLGLAHSSNSTTWPDDKFTEGELHILENDPNLIVIRLQDMPDNTGNSEAVSSLAVERDSLKVRVSELEAVVLQLNQDGDTLKKQLASANGTVTELGAERDVLRQELEAIKAAQPASDKKVKG